MRAADPAVCVLPVMTHVATVVDDVEGQRGEAQGEIATEDGLIWDGQLGDRGLGCITLCR